MLYCSKLSDIVSDSSFNYYHNLYCKPPIFLFYYNQLFIPIINKLW